MMIENNKVRLLFPFLKKDMIYFDSAATSLKPLTVIEAHSDYYKNLTLNVGRGSSLHNYSVTESIESIRKSTANFIGATNPKEIVYTNNTTDSINIVANSYIKHKLTEGSNIVITQLEHHSNYVPWVNLAKTMNIECRIIPLKNHRIDMDLFKDYIDEKTILTAVTGMSNLTGQQLDIKKIVSICRGVNSKVLVDGAQLITHKNIDVKELDLDFFVFSAHKLYGPFGLGILYGKKELLEDFTPNSYGGNMVSYISNKTDIHYKDIPTRLESGTQNSAGIYSFGEVLNFLKVHPVESGEIILNSLGDYLITGLNKIGEITIYSVIGGIVSFNINGVHPHDASEFFDKKNIILRTGNLCASPFFTNLDELGVIRVSFGIFNNFKEIDILLNTVQEIKEFFL